VTRSQTIAAAIGVLGLTASSLTIAATSPAPATAHTHATLAPKAADLPAIVWPAEFQPGSTDNYVSNEVIVKGLSAETVWPYLVDTRAWPTYYDNAKDIEFHNGAGPQLVAGARFRFTTFGFPVESEVMEFVPPQGARPGRVAWHGWVEGDADHRLDVYHAWLIQNLPGNRVRILTQESQAGKPARDLRGARPNPMLNKHQEWVEGLAQAAKAKAEIK